MNIDIIKYGSSLVLTSMGLLKHPNLPFNLPNAFSINMRALDNLQPNIVLSHIFHFLGIPSLKMGAKGMPGPLR